MATLDPDALKQFQFLVFTKLEGAVTAGMIHLGDRLGLYRVLADADGAAHVGRAGRRRRPRRAVGAGVGLQPGGGQGHPGRQSTTTAGRSGSRSRRRRPPSWRRPTTRRSGWACSTGCPRRWRRSRTLPESFRTGLGHDYDSHGPEGAVGIERSFEPWNRAHLLPDVLPELDGRRRQAGRRRHRRRHRVRRRRCRPPAWPGRSRTAASPATTSPSTPSTGPASGWPTPG